MSNQSNAMMTPRALLYVATEAGGAACWVDDITSIEDCEDGCMVWLTPYGAGMRCIVSTWSTQQVMGILRETEECPDATPFPWTPGPSITVTVHDTVTGVQVTDNKHDWDWWAGGGGAYDHFRESLFRPARAVASYDRTQQQRYLIVAARECSVAGLNRGYPADLLARFDIPTEVQP